MVFLLIILHALVFRFEQNLYYTALAAAQCIVIGRLFVCGWMGVCLWMGLLP